MKISPHLSRAASRRGFTLIEILVVITIIAVLAGLLFPAMSAVRESARKASAKNDIMQIVNAVKNFMTDYGRMPAPTGTVGTAPVSNATLMTVLRGVETAATKTNPRAIRYLEIPEKTATSSSTVTRSGIVKPSSGTAAGTSDWFDPWENAYVIWIDPNNQTVTPGNGVTMSSGGTCDFGTAAVRTGVAAGSGGPKKTGTKPYPQPVKSWE